MNYNALISKDSINKVYRVFYGTPLENSFTNKTAAINFINKVQKSIIALTENVVKFSGVALITDKRYLNVVLGALQTCSRINNIIQYPTSNGYLNVVNNAFLLMVNIEGVDVYRNMEVYVNAMYDLQKSVK